MKVSRTMILSYISMALGVLVALGLLNMESQAVVLEHINGIIGSVMVLYGVVMAVLRKITTTPLLGWLSKN